uniref:Chloride channel CLIC-like protein 1 n=1 Tax=Parascaris univalens TaxID=6257 RepID=A0A915BHF4_PARUN
MLLNEQHVLLILISLITTANVTATPEYSDPTAQELALLDWASGIRVAYCADTAVEKLAEPFRSSLAVWLNKYCRNATACFLVKPVGFTSEQVVLLDGYPKRDYGTVQFRFVVVLPHGAVPRAKLRQPLLSKQILANFLRKHIDDVAQRLGWKVLSYERFPKFDAITEFMNTALIPIGFFLLIFMFFIAYWSSTFSSSIGSSDTWMITGTSGSKNNAVRKTLKMMEEQKEYDQEHELDEQHNRTEGVDGPMLASMSSTAKEISSGKATGDVILDASRLSNESISTAGQSLALSQESGFLAVPEIVVVPTDGRTPISGGRERPSITSSRRFSRRLSSFEDLVKEKRHRRMRTHGLGGSGAKRSWKSGSMALGGFGKS